MKDITGLGNEELREAKASKAHEKKNILALDVKSSEGITLRELEMARKITLLEKQ